MGPMGGAFSSDLALEADQESGKQPMANVFSCTLPLEHDELVAAWVARVRAAQIRVKERGRNSQDVWWLH